MSSYLNTHILVIDTKFITKNNFYTNTNFIVKSNGINKKTIKKIKLETLEFPCPKEAPELYYNFENVIKNNNSFIITINNVEYMIKVKNNYYTLNTLIEEVNKDITTKIPNELIKLVLNSDSDYKCYFESSIDIIIDFEKHRMNNNSYNSIGKTFGFINSKYIYNKALSPNIISEECANITFDNYFYISIGDGGSIFSGHIENVQNNYNNTSIVKSSINTTDYTFIVALNNTYDTKYISREVVFDKPINMNNIFIRLYNSNGNIINLKNINYTIILNLSLYNND